MPMSPNPDIPALLAEAARGPNKTTPVETVSTAWDLVDRLAAALRTTHEARVRAEEAIRWALGEGDSDFGDHMPEPKLIPDLSVMRIHTYWWRDELRRRAALSLPQGEK